MSLNDWQKELTKLEYVGEAAAGLIKVKVNGLGYPTEVEIDDKVFESKDKQFISDVFCAACLDGIKKADAGAQQYMAQKLLDAYDQALYEQLGKGGFDDGTKN